jgi:hypothetical protein
MAWAEVQLKPVARAVTPGDHLMGDHLMLVSWPNR